MRTTIRFFVAIWYLLGWVSHVYLGIFQPAIYQGFGDTALIPAFTVFWHDIVMPNITFFALLLAVYEITVGLLLINKGKWVKIGLVLSMLFNLFLVQMGLAIQSPDPWQSFLMNRLPNIIFILLQLPLLQDWNNETFLEIIRNRLHPNPQP